MTGRAAPDGASRPAADRIKVVREADRESIWFLGNLNQILVDKNDSEGQVYIGVTHAPPLNEPPLHQHETDDEMMYLLEGEVTFWAGDVEATLQAGDFIYMPRGVPHTFQVSANTSAKWIDIMVPTGFENVVRTVGVPALHRGSQEGFEMTEEIRTTLMQAMEDAQITFLGPPGTRPRDIAKNAG